jgi:hypothetical protein
MSVIDDVAEYLFALLDAVDTGTELQVQLGRPATINLVLTDEGDDLVQAPLAEVDAVGDAQLIFAARRDVRVLEVIESAPNLVAEIIKIATERNQVITEIGYVTGQTGKTVAKVVDSLVDVVEVGRRNEAAVRGAAATA